MRDHIILEGFQRITDAITDDLAKLTRANSMLRTRLDALEGVLFESRIGLIKMIIMQLISPRLVAETVSYRHSEEISKFNRSRQDASKMRPIVKQPPTKGIITVH